MTRPLTEADKREGFIRATSGFSRAEQRWGERAASGLTDRELAEVLGFELGIFGGSGGSGSLHLTYLGAGLKIWISWHTYNHVTMSPTFEGRSTITMARYVYGIKDPADGQVSQL